MRVLLIKTSSLGDIIHMLPAITDAGNALPGIQFDWVVEENFAEIPAWHRDIKQVIPVALRRFRKTLFSRKTWREWRHCQTLLRAQEYDLIIDAQGLLKSAFLALNARGTRVGFDLASAREPYAAWFYQKKYQVAKKQHAIIRLRMLMSQALGYALPNTLPDYGIKTDVFTKTVTSAQHVVFLHGTTWDSKHWPEAYWIDLATIAKQDGFVVQLPWGSAVEKLRAERIADASGAIVLERLNLSGMAAVLANAKGVVSVDTGLGHLATALNVPTIGLFGPTDPLLSGFLGRQQQNKVVNFPCAPCLKRECRLLADDTITYPIKPPCFTTLTPDIVWQAFRDQHLR